MVWGFNNNSSTTQIIVSLCANEVKFCLIKKTSNIIQQLASHKANYTDQQSLHDESIKWIRENRCKGLNCHWILSRKLYTTLSIKPPEVKPSELGHTVKWLIKDQIEQPIDSILTAHYTPYHLDKENQKLTVVVAEKNLIENLIELTKESNLQLASIQISELAPAGALQSKTKLKTSSSAQPEDKITGFIDQDQSGLIYNFYVGSSLAFTRHIKGRFFPKTSEGEFSLENDNRQSQVDQFLLETQRTLDYCISQIFRKPVDSLILDASKVDDQELVTALEQLTELPITRFEYNQLTTETSTQSPEHEHEQEQEHEPVDQLSLTEIGATFFQESLSTEQSVNFYLSEYQPKPLEFGFKFAVSVAAVFILAFFGYGYLQNQQLSQLEQQFTDNQIKLQKTQELIKKIQKQRGKTSPTQNIQKQILRKQKELVASKKLLAKVINKKAIKPVSYSQVLNALSQQKEKRLWLTKIDLYPESINLTGQATDPAAIPAYIAKMATNNLLSSEFEEFQIKRDINDRRIVNFSMNNGRYKNAN